MAWVDYSKIPIYPIIYFRGNIVGHGRTENELGDNMEATESMPPVLTYYNKQEINNGGSSSKRGENRCFSVVGSSKFGFRF